MSLVLDAVKGFALGLVVFGAIPLAVRPFDWDRSASVVNFYHDLAMKTLDRGLLTFQPNRGFKWVRTSFDPLTQTEQTSIGGERHDWSNDGEMMATLLGRKIGIALMQSQQIVDARYLAVVKRLEEWRRRGEFAIDANGTEHVRELVAFDADSAGGVWPGEAWPAWIQEQLSPTKTGTIDEFAKEGQSMFDSSTAWQAGKWLTAMGATVGLYWLAVEAAGTSASTTLVGVVL